MTSPARNERRWTIYDCPECGVWVREEETEFHPAAESVVVMPVFEHEAALAAARQVDAKRIGEAVRREFPLTGFPASLERAILAALTPEPEEKR